MKILEKAHDALDQKHGELDNLLFDTQLLSGMVRHFEYLVDDLVKGTPSFTVLLLSVESQGQGEQNVAKHLVQFGLRSVHG